MEPSEEFPFPFPPYEIQKQFMKELYRCLENGKLGIFESPTGTGKSMSVICGALKWLIDYEEDQKRRLNSAISELDEKIKSCSNSSASWFYVQTEQIHLNTEKQALEVQLNNIIKYESKRNKLKDIAEKQSKVQAKSYNKTKTDYSKKEKDTDENSLTMEKLDIEEKNIEADLLLDELKQLDDSEEEEEEEEPFEGTKIFFCSRTHSQLSQFVGELKKSPYFDKVSVIPLASRQNYCINANVKKLKNLNLINESCLQMQRKKTTVKEEKDVKKKKTTASCPFMPGSQDLLIGETLLEIQDVESIAQKGKDMKTCAYYASRKAVPHGQLILVPYNSILHKSTRISSGINLKGNVLIIDEAHNLLDAIERMHSIVITGRNLLHCYNQLSQYQKRFQALFLAKTVLSLSQLSFFLKKLLSIFGATTKSTPNDAVREGAASKLYKIEEFELMAEIETISIFELLDFIKNSRLSHKLQGFVEQYGNLKIHEPNVAKTSGVTQFLNSIKNKDSDSEQPAVSTETMKTEEESNNPLLRIIGFLECLKSKSEDGRICVTPGPTIGQSIVKFLLLNPAAHFHDIVKDARAVVLAGGTMAPISEFTEQLFVAAGAEHKRIVTFSCDHVVPQENIVCNIVTHGPGGTELEFNFQNRQNTNLLDELGRALINVCNVVPAGIVVFLPSYDFESLMYKHLDKSGVITKISSKKYVFREPKLASQVNAVLEEYASRIKNPKAPQNGAILFNVVGGKLSEGLNFSDDLGRCVVVVGMPYPNIKSAELQEKMKYLNENVKADAGRIFYENSCMKAVNQCIGRAIRHINDYATVILLDKRFSHKTKALPSWIQRTLVNHNNFGSMIGTVAKFFAKKRNSSVQHK